MFISAHIHMSFENNYIIYGDGTVVRPAYSILQVDCHPALAPSKRLSLRVMCACDVPTHRSE